MKYLLAVHTSSDLGVESWQTYFRLRTKRERLPKWDFILVTKDLGGKQKIYINRNCILYYTSQKIDG